MKTSSFLRSVFIFVAIALLSCSHTEGESAFSVQLSIPEEVTVSAPEMEISFRVVGKMAPENTDVLVFKGLSESIECQFTKITSSRVYSVLPESFESGSYTVAVARGANVRDMGKTNITVDKKDINITKPHNVFGKVTSSAGSPLSDVLVSDGVQIVKTDKDGVYFMESDKSSRCVFVIVPSGYEVSQMGILPAFHRVFKSGKEDAERFDFKLTPSDSQENHTMLFFGDMHLANRSNNKDRIQFAAFTADVNNYLSSNPAENVYGMTLGDMTWDLYWYKNQYYFPEYLNDVNVIKGLPMFHTIGNHDHEMNAAGDEQTVEKYRSFIAPTYYSFNIGKVHYVVLDNILCTNDGKGSRTYNSEVTEAQLKWLEKDLSFVDKSGVVVLCMHAPLYRNDGSNNMSSTSKIESLLSQFAESHVFTGHSHKVYNVDKLSSKNIFEHNAGAVCATWWWSAAHTPGIHIGQDGAPGGYTIVDVAGTKLSWQFKPTGGNVSTQFRTYDRNNISITADKYIPKAHSGSKANFEKYAKNWISSSTDNHVYINIWNYDPSWTIEVTENGKKLSVERVSIEDPLHLIAYTAPSMNNSKSAVTPSFPTYPTYHIFKVQASSADADLVVTVTDRFNNKYVENMARPKEFNIQTYK